MKTPWVLMLVIALLLAPGIAKGQQVTGAVVPEDRVQKVLHVDVDNQAASDENPGTEAQPLKTAAQAIKLAVENNLKNMGVKVVFHPGTYRESIDLDATKSTGKPTDAPIVLEASEKGKAVICGSDVWTGWKQEGGVYTRDWPFKWGLSPRPKGWESLDIGPLALRREVIFVDGKLVTQVLSREELKENTFYVSEESGSVYLWLPQGASIDKSAVEVGVRTPLIDIRGRKNVVVRGLTFQHDTAGLAGGMGGASGCSDILVEDCLFTWNNQSGFGFSRSNNVTARRNRSLHNGGSGMGVHRTSNLIFEDNETSHNNWRNFWGGFIRWAPCGIKILHSHNAIFRRHKSVGNLCRGFWLDTDCGNYLIEDSHFAENLTDGIFFEAIQGPVTLKNSVLCFNKRYGLMTTASMNVTLEGNIIYGNAEGQFRVNSVAKVAGWDYLVDKEVPVRMENWTLKNNCFVSTASYQWLVESPAYDHFFRTLTSSGNLWYNGANPNSFYVSEFGLSFDDWQSLGAQDLDSICADPRFADPAKQRFEPLAASPLKNKGAWPKREVAAAGPDILKQKMTQKIKDNWAEPFPAAVGVKGWSKIDLKPVANQTQPNAKAWPGQSFLAPGEKIIHGAPFEIIDPAQNGDKAVVALPSAKAVVIPVGRKVKAFYIFHGCGPVGAHGKVAAYEFVYSDGTQTGLDVVAMGDWGKDVDITEQNAAKSNIQDWRSTAPSFSNENARRVIIGLETELGYPRSLYAVQWTNPRPEKEVKEIRLAPEGAKGPQVLVLAITAANAP